MFKIRLFFKASGFGIGSADTFLVSHRYWFGESLYKYWVKRSRLLAPQPITHYNLEYVKHHKQMYYMDRDTCSVLAIKNYMVSGYWLVRIYIYRPAY